MEWWRAPQTRMLALLATRSLGVLDPGPPEVAVPGRNSFIRLANGSPLEFPFGSQDFRLSVGHSEVGGVGLA
jgi:hypothetical protein